MCCALGRADPGCFTSPSGCIRPFIYLGELKIYRGRFDPRDNPPDTPGQILAGRFVGWVCVSWNVFEPGTGPSPRVPRVEKVNEAGRIRNTRVAFGKGRQGAGVVYPVDHLPAGEGLRHREVGRERTQYLDLTDLLVSANQSLDQFGRHFCAAMAEIVF